MTNNKFSTNIIIYGIVFLLLVVMSFLLIKNARDDSATTDEPIHILSGYEYWQGTFTVNPEHPPLGKQIATIPLNFIKPNLPEDKYFQSAISDYYYDSWSETRSYAQSWLYNTFGNNADKIVFYPRLMVVIFTIILAVIIFFVASRWYGKFAALISVFFFAFSPLILTHGHFANTDLWATLGYFVSIFSFAWFLEKPNYTRMILAAILFEGALLFKFSTILLIIILLLLWIGKYRLEKNKEEYNYKKFIITTFVFLITSVFLIWADYGFTTSFAPDIVLQSGRNYIWKSLQTLSPLLKHLPVPEYWKGLIMVFSNSVANRESYLLGNIINGGTWYYFPVAFMVKEPLSFIILIISGITFWIANRKKLEFRDWILIIPIMVYGFVSLFSKLNIGIRHLMPIYPFLFIFVGYFISEFYQKIKTNRNLLIAYGLLLTALMGWYLYANISVYPYYMTYFNEIAGGPKNGPKILTDSNIDWGQDTKRLANWIKEQKIDEPVKMEYFWSSFLQPEYYGIQFTKLEENNPNQKGWIAIGVSAMEKPDFSWLKNYEPTKIIGNSIYVYNIQ